VVETARILREAYAETLIVPLTVLNAAFGEAVPTDDRDPEHVADYILARLGVVSTGSD